MTTDNDTTKRGYENRAIITEIVWETRWNGSRLQFVTKTRALERQARVLKAYPNANASVWRIVNRRTEARSFGYDKTFERISEERVA